jgi:uncharacterized protein
MTTSPPPGPPSGHGQQPGAPQTTQEERTWALASHIGSVVGAWVAMAFLVPLAVLLVKGNSSPFVRHHAVESLNFQLSMLLYLFAGILLSVLTLGLGLIVVVPIGVVIGILWLVVVVMATIKASNGEFYRYPITIRFVS